MVQIIDVENDGFVTDSGSEDSQIDEKENGRLTIKESADDEDDSAAIARETMLDRIRALKDIVPPMTRYRLSQTYSSAAGWTKTVGKFAGNLGWAVTTSALLIVVPLALMMEEESARGEMSYASGAPEGTLLAPTDEPALAVKAPGF